MGIKGLFKVISDNAPGAVRVTDWKAIAGRKVAIDASMSLYQFLIAVRQNDGFQLANETGETTSHLIGIFYRTIKIIENGMKPVYVFDGKPPDLKSDELKKRDAVRDKATKSKGDAETAEDVNRFERRTVKVTKEQNEEAKRLLRLMGVPVVEAPGEAEAQCAVLARADKVWATATEDMDTLSFGSPILLRHLTAGDQKKSPITELDLKKVLDEMKLTQNEFIDLCILLGCDYCDPIRGMGPMTAYKLVQEHRSIEKIKESLSTKGGKIQIADDWPYEQVRELFRSPDAIAAEDVNFAWTEPDVDGLIQFLVKEKGFSEDRIRAGAAKLSKGSTTAPQGRLTDFFRVSKRPAAEVTKSKKKTKK